MKRTLRTAVAALLSVGILAGSVLTSSAAFTDVPSNHWAYTYVQKASTNGLVSGIGGGLYGVDNKLSAADFSTMVCALLYPGKADALKGKSSYWWYPYMETAYQVGLLSGTTAGNRRAADGAWYSSVAEAKLTRYDLAQIIYNAQKLQSWEAPDATKLLIYMSLIPDWNQIPSNYQTPVLMAYAGGFLTGMDDKGTFKGNEAMTRGQAAVVLCAMLDASKKVTTPTYNNRNGKLVNGDDATETNVKSALRELQYDYYEGQVWDVTRTYTSAKLGTGTGSRGFAYMISDKVFGALPSQTVTKFSQLKPGDLIYLNDKDWYGVVTNVDGDDFDYVYCSGLGLVSWKGSGSIDDLGNKDVVYTRYEGEEKDEDVLANGDEATERNVQRLLDELMDEYEDGDEWDKRYESDVLGSGRDDKGFAYMISDEIFGDLDVEELDSVYDMRAGDIVYRFDEGIYVIVLEVDTSDDTFTYLYLNSNNEVCWNDRDWLDMDRYDTVYTRYPTDADDDDDRDDDTLSNGKSPTQSNVADLIEKFQDEEYSEGDKWDSSYKSDVLGKQSRVYGSEAFAYYFSDYIFDELDVSQSSLDDIAVGDIIWLDDKGEDGEYIYCVVTDVTSSRVYYLYAEYNERSDVYYIASDDQRISSLEEDYDIVYTRYP